MLEVTRGQIEGERARARGAACGWIEDPRTPNAFRAIFCGSGSCR